MSSVALRGVPDVLLVPGLGLDRRSWVRVRRRIAADVVLLPGMGLRTAVPSTDELAGLLLARLGPGPVLLVGHSQSCQVAAVAAARDERIVGVLLLGPTTDPPMRRLPVLAARWVRTAVREPVWQVPLVMAQWLRTGPRAMAALWRRTAPDPVDDRLRGVAVPVVVVRGTRDALCPRDWALHLAGCAPHGRLVELPGAAHMTPQTRPDDVVRLLRELGAAPAGPARGRPGRRG
ncbi:Pimeloyl-ACP methyl ester carboxylesterase [Modestobacter sp. DSM 44400]|uniref:alpha/beta fold hydrolase n=1 Tax=Modestobacter sp. DSM 44400 TaxID=1550230 RepID=UPI000897EEE9|nr:alpha/beta hydrolase [Modestobacter sp. DSM 44400]SDX76078.1 Pimeloyl-ACP methyl ester carboxylesterase [Modestobacter sp. DSM 44400]